MWEFDTDEFLYMVEFYMHANINIECAFGIRSTSFLMFIVNGGPYLFGQKLLFMYSVCVLILIFYNIKIMIIHYERRFFLANKDSFCFRRLMEAN